MQHSLFGVERTGTARVFRLVGARVRGASGVQVPHSLPLGVHDVKAAAGRHTAGHHPATVRDDDQIFGVWTPQTKLSSPAGAQLDVGAWAALREREEQIAAHTSVVARMVFFMIVSERDAGSRRV